MQLLVPLDALEWMERGACRNASADMFFPEKGDAYTAHAAKTICKRCAVRDECLDYAFKHRIGYGIWGATTEDDRRVLRGMRPHGQSRRAAV